MFSAAEAERVAEIVATICLPGAEMADKAQFVGRYEAYKIREGKWGIVYRVSERESFDQRVSYPTKRRAVAMAALLNRSGA